MIRRLFNLLLIFLMLANQGLCLAHTHHGDEPDGHDSRPHFHVGEHDHHHGDHSHSDHSNEAPDSEKSDSAPPSAFLPVGEHDADAVYCGEPVTIARAGNTTSVLPEKDVTGVATLPRENSRGGPRQVEPWQRQSSSVDDADLPIYLRTLSLRL